MYLFAIKIANCSVTVLVYPIVSLGWFRDALGAVTVPFIGWKCHSKSICCDQMKFLFLYQTEGDALGNFNLSQRMLSLVSDSYFA